MSKEAKKIRAQIRRLNRKASSLEQKEKWRIEYPKAKALEGTIWKYKSCYSSPRVASDWWWLYCRVVKVNKDLGMEVIEFQTDQYGKCTVELDAARYWPMLEGWKKCSQTEWDREVKKLRNKLKELG